MPRKLTFEYIKSQIDKEDTLISDEYFNSKSKLEFQQYLKNKIP